MNQDEADSDDDKDGDYLPPIGLDLMLKEKMAATGIVNLKGFDDNVIQWGLENRTPRTDQHPNSEPLFDRKSEGSVFERKMAAILNRPSENRLA